MQVAGLASAKAVSCGPDYSCALMDDGSVKCWGRNATGCLGDGTRNDTWSPVTVKGLTLAERITTGEGHACALRKDGTAWCWGANQGAQLGNGNALENLDPGPVVDLIEAVSISAGSGYTCAALKNGAGRCWGRNGDDLGGDYLDGPRFFGVLGNDIKEKATRPQPVLNLEGAVHISAGILHACAVIRDGTVKCWGHNDEPCPYSSDENPDGEKCQDIRNGIIGSGKKNFIEKYPVPVNGLANCNEISAGKLHTCALKKGGEVWCWGVNHYGEVGTGNRDVQPLPVKVKNLPEATAVDVGATFSCAILKIGRIMCWGKNEAGLGDGTNSDRLEPVDVVFQRKNDTVLSPKSDISPTKVREVRPVPRGEYTVTASGFLKPAAGLTYSPENAVDNDLSTWWTPSPNRDGKGAWLRLDFKTQRVITGIEILGGSRYENFPKYGNLWEKNNRLTRAKLQFSGGEHVIINLTPDDKLQKSEFSPVETSHIILFPEVWINGSKWNDLCLSLIRPLEQVPQGEKK